MPIQYLCVCGRAIVARDDHAGKLQRCPSCRMSVQVPDTPPAEPKPGGGSLGPRAPRDA